MTQSSIEGENCRILVVEDDPSIRRALGRAFRSAGYEAEFAANLLESYAKLNGHHVVLLDLQLPDGCGTELLRRIRQGTRSIRVAVYSGLIDAREVVAACGEAPDALFHKPFDFEQLLAWVAQTEGSR